jgi:hypothetical protein
MTAPSPFAAMRRLHERGPRSRGLVVDRDGVALGPSMTLLCSRGMGYECVDPHSLVRVARIAFGADAQLGKLSRLLGAIARALEAGDLPRAQLLGLEIPIVELDDAQLAKLAAAANLIKAGFDPSQSRDEGGRWSSDGGGSGVREPVPVQIADAGEGMSDADGILPAATNRQAPQPIQAPSATIPPPVQRSGNVGEYSPSEAAKLPPPQSGSKYVTLNDGSVIWSGYMNDGRGGPMLMPDDVSLEDNVKMGQSLAGFPQVPPSVDAGVSPREGAMAYLFLPGHGPMDYQSAYGTKGQYNRNFVDFTNYNYGIVAAAAGYSQEEALANAGMANQATDWWDRNVHGDRPKDTSGPFGNKVQNAEMIIKGYDHYKTGRIGGPRK